jgi:DNA end-binding protein Ku
MPRAIWKGAISFGLVNVPVEAYPADQSDALSFAMLDKRDFAPVGYKRYNKKSGKEVPWKDIVKGYEYDKDRYVVLTDEDFRRANVRASQTIDIDTFVPRDAIPGAFYETPYYLVPDRRGQKAFVLLRDTLASEDKVGIGQVVIRNRQHLVAVIPDGSVLIMNILRYAGEIRRLEGLDVPPKAAKSAGVSPREIELARKLIDDMSGPWKPAEFKDTYRDDLMKRIDEKIKRGETRELTAPEKGAGEPKSAQVIDLMEALKRSLDRRDGKATARDAPAERKKPVKTGASRTRTRSTGTARRKRA